ncbi:uncharacterized protein LOC115222545 [Argonauta hians]
MDFNFNFTVFDYIRIVTMPFIFLPSLVLSVKSWLLADMSIQLTLGIFALLFPNEFLRRQLSEDTIVDESHLVLMRIYGAIHIGAASVLYRGRLSKDESVTGTILWSRILGLSIQILTLVYHAVFIIDKFNTFFLYFVVGNFLLWLMANFIQIIRKQPKLGHYEPETLLTWVIRSEFFVTFLVGLAYMAFPDFLTSLFVPKRDLIHVYITQLVGGSTLGGIWLSWYSTSFFLERDIKAVLISRISTAVLIFAVIAHSHISLGYPKLENMWLFFTWFIPFILASVGLIMIGARRKYPIKKKSS